MIADTLKKEPVAFALTSIGHVAGWLFPSKEQGERTVKALLDENERLRAALLQVVTVCDDNRGVNCDHSAALAFVRDVANSPLRGS